MQKKLIASIIASSLLSPVVYADPATTIEVIGRSGQESMNQQKISKQAIQANISASSDVVDVLTQSPSVSVNQAGAVSGFPVMRGVADDRLNIEIDGMPLLSSCPNHMNTPLSYVSPSQTDGVEIYPGITPVSVGGDSIGGSILVNTNRPFFAPSSEVVTQGEIGAFYRNNSNAKGGDVSVTVANDQFSATYKGSRSLADNYHAADDFKNFTTTTNAAAGTEFTSGTEGTTTDKNEVAGTAYESINQSLGLAYQGQDKLLQATITKQHMPFQQYPNQRMDMTSNDSTKLNLSYDQGMSWGDVTLQAYSEKVDHVMAFMDYKTAKQMPMDTRSDTIGLKAAALVGLSNASDLNVGAELQQYTLDDYWKPNPASAGMSPNTFSNINNGTRDRNALFAEWINQLTPAWKTRIGARYERVDMNADQVQGYHTANFFNKPASKGGAKVKTNEAAESAAFNAASRSVSDNNLNLTALASYEASDTFAVEMGLARQVRSPSLYERYTWSTWSMAAVMNNFVGDGNGYMGDINLKPETAYTLSTTLDWHAANPQDWNVQVMPYFSRIEDYVDAKLVKSYGDFGVYQYANQRARIYGLDIASNMQLAENALGNWRAKAKLNYARGTNLDTDDNLYNIMPLNATIGLMQESNHWHNSLELIVVSDKKDVSKNRNELKTAGYSLVNVQTSYTFENLRIDLGIDNLFNRAYNLPTGGAYTGEGKTMSIKGIPLLAVAGAARTFYTGFNFKF